MLLLVSSALAEESCPRKFTAEEVDEAVARGLRQYVEMEADKLKEERNEAVRRLACLGEQPTKKQIASFHLLQAVTARLEDNTNHVYAALAGAFQSVPGYQLPADIVPPTDPLIAYVPGAQGALADAVPRIKGEPPTGWYTVNGAASNPLYVGVSAIIQEITKDGTVTGTWYVWPEDAWPPEGSDPPPLAVHAEPRVFLGVNWLLGEDAIEDPFGSQLHGGGVAAAAGTDLWFGPTFGIGAELAYRDIFGGAPTYGQAHGAFGFLGPSLRLGRVDLAAGGSFGLVWAAFEPDPAAYDPGAPIGVTHGTLTMGGVAGRAAVHLFNLGATDGRLRLDGGAWTTTDRWLGQVSAGLELGFGVPR